MNSNFRFIQLDEEGYFHFNGVRVVDTEQGQHLLSQLRQEGLRFVTHSDGYDVIVEAFDEPYVVKQVFKKPGQKWKALMPYQFQIDFDLHTLSVDEWDRFHGVATNGVPFILSNSAQHDFFDQLDEFDDDSITADGERILVGPWLIDCQGDSTPDHAEFWSCKYKQEEKPGWELDAPSPPLVNIVPRLKIPKSRIIVLGCGTGNDASFLASQGHLVTAVDISEEAILRAKAKYPETKLLKYIHDDIFNLGQDHFKQYDVVFEHTCYCAVNPSRRNDLVVLWRKLLRETGHLLGVFFTMEKRTGPPFRSDEHTYELQ